MASLGELVATMSLNIGQFTGALSKVEQAVADATRNITKEFEKINGSLTGMVTGFLSVSTAVELFNKAVDQAADLKDVGAAFDITVGKMDELSLAMKLAGVDSATLEKELKTLGNQVTLASNPASKSAAVFAAMGIAIKDASGNMLGLDEIYENAIKRLGAIEDPALRASAAMTLFGKGADEALKAVAQLDPALETARKQLDAFGVTTDQVAVSAKQYKDSMLLLSDATSRVVQPIVAALGPVFDDIRKAMLESGKGSVDLAKDLGDGLATAFRVLVAVVIESVGELKGVGIALGGLAAAAAALVRPGGGWGAAGAVLKEMAGDIKANSDATAAATDAILNHTEAYAYWHKSTTTTIADQAALRAALAKMTDGTKAAATELATFTKLETEQIAKQDALTATTDTWNAGTTEQVAMLKKINDAFAAGHPFTLQHAADLMADAAATDALAFAEKQWLDQNKAVQQARDDYQKSLDQTTKALQDHLKAQEDELAKQVATKAAVEQLGTAYKDLAPYLVAYNTDAAQLATLQADMTQQQANFTTANAAYVESLREQITALQKKLGLDQQDFAQRKQDIDQSKTWAQGWSDAFKQYEDSANDAKMAATAFNTLTSSMEQLFVNFANHSAGAWKTFTNSIMQGIDQMAAKWAVSGLANMVFNPTASGSMFGGAASGATSGLTGGLTSALTSGGGIGDALMGGAGSGVLGAVGTSFTNVGLAASAGVDAIGGFSMALTAALPAIGAIAAVGFIAYQLLSKPGGGPKQGGSASTTGGPWANFDVAGGTRGYTPSDADSALTTIVKTNQQSYDTLVTALGGKAGGAQFNLAYDTDPQGTAGTRIKAAATVNGQQVYGDTNRQFGNDSGDALTADLTLEAKRTLLAALQASDLPTQISGLLKTLTASTATDDQITQMLTVVQTVTSMNAALAVLADPMTAATKSLATANETALSAWDDQRTALYDLANAAPDTADGLAAVTAATQAFAVSTVNLLIAIQNAKQAMDDMFASSTDSITKAGLTNEQLYAMDQSKEAALKAQLATATDPTVISSIAKQINDVITDAFGLLSPDDQLTQKGAFLADIASTQATADKAMTDAATTVATQATTDHDFMTQKLGDILDGITAAGKDFKDGADSLAGGVNVNVTVNSTPQSDVNG